MKSSADFPPNLRGLQFVTIWAAQHAHLLSEYFATSVHTTTASTNRDDNAASPRTNVADTSVAFPIKSLHRRYRSETADYLARKRKTLLSVRVN
jgi:hypothetical protein